MPLHPNPEPVIEVAETIFVQGSALSWSKEGRHPVH